MSQPIKSCFDPATTKKSQLFAKSNSGDVGPARGRRTEEEASGDRPTEEVFSGTSDTSVRRLVVVVCLIITWKIYLSHTETKASHEIKSFTKFPKKICIGSRVQNYVPKSTDPYSARTRRVNIHGYKCDRLPQQAFVI